MERHIRIDDKHSIVIQDQMSVDEVKKAFSHAPLSWEEVKEILDWLDEEE